ncbi:hypothetical protein EVA_11292 [gut metagenome]|uniref:Uncharacterized protein n=1 Tax=gut metagenome TaxID=749906 RepID=J9G1A0_9ZZZZ
MAVGEVMSSFTPLPSIAARSPSSSPVLPSLSFTTA